MPQFGAAATSVTSDQQFTLSADDYNYTVLASARHVSCRCFMWPGACR